MKITLNIEEIKPREVNGKLFIIIYFTVKAEGTIFKYRGNGGLYNDEETEWRICSDGRPDVYVEQKALYIQGRSKENDNDKVYCAIGSFCSILKTVNNFNKNNKF